ncbi:glutathione peroxidase [Lactococcus sp. dk322]|uniref:glutathione peroxidase n=1 Tax=Lactococcus sp. dk322 TaxID=2603290 RepID=UPI0011CC7198|nr:glutathione peroxidase [Lactococcus sp. dk322]TXK47399.1 glutathione peroxidase [Lactococcus sp. dk322]
MSLYDYEATLASGENYSMSKFKGKVIVIVNTATKCGLSPQFEALEKIYQDYKNKGLVVLGFPSNQFKQELENSKGAEEACRLNYGVTFPMHQISDVNGTHQNPIFKYLTSNSKSVFGKKIKWNFTKFIVDKEGHVIKRYSPKDSPEKMRKMIEELL